MTRRRPARLAAAAVVASGVLAAGVMMPAAADPAPRAAIPMRRAADGPATTAYRPLAACRLLDTRNAGAQLMPDQIVAVPTVDRCGIPADAAALVVTITVTDALGAGFVTVWPGGSDRPATSMVNIATGETRANGAVVRVGDDGNLLLATTAAAHAVVDVTGVFTAASQARAGRFVAMAPQRVLDTRDAVGRLTPGGSITVPLPIGVPRDATALSVSITTTDSLGAGYLTTYLPGAAVPASSMLNTDGLGQTRATGLIVPVRVDGFAVFSQTGEHVIVDVTGWFTGPSSASSPNGLFVPSTPVRLIDSRGSTPVYPTGTIEVDTTSIAGAPVAAIAANWTLTDTWKGGFLTAYAARTPQPATATANADRRDETVSQFGITSTSTAGIAMYDSGGSHVVVDVAGWFLGTPAVGSLAGPPANTVVADTDRRVLLMGDSTLAGVRWYTNAQHALGGASFILDAESCRRLIGTSCWGREKRTPPNAIDAITNHEGTFDTVVVMTGYNDWAGNFNDAFDQVVAASRAKGATEILWLTYREGTAYRNPSGGTKQDKGFRQQNEILRDKVASGLFPDVRLLDWNLYSAATTGWFTKDGVHFTIAGAYGAADYISRQIAFGHHEPCPAPWALGEGVEVPCSDPDGHAGMVDPVTLYAGNPNDIHCYDVGSDHHVSCRKDAKLSQ